MKERIRIWLVQGSVRATVRGGLSVIVAGAVIALLALAVLGVVALLVPLLEKYVSSSSSLVRSAPWLGP